MEILPSGSEYWVATCPFANSLSIHSFGATKRPSPDGRILGKMAHSERRDRSVAQNIYGEQDLKIFESGVAYFK